MKVLAINYFNPTPIGAITDDSQLIKAFSFSTGKMETYLKKDIINATSMMDEVGKFTKLEYGLFNTIRSVSSFIKSGMILRSKLNREHFDVVHAQWGGPLSFLAVIFSNVPVVVSFCGSDLLGGVDTIGNYTPRGYLGRLLSLISAIFSNQIITKSMHLKESLGKFGKHKTTVIPNGVDNSKFYPLTREIALEKTGWNKKNKHIIFFNGQDSDVKNQSLAEQIFKELHKKDAKIEFHILKSIPFDDLIYYYNAADVMLLTSFHEGSNNSIKEALACNLPIVSTNVGDAYERLHHVKNCFVINSFNYSDFLPKVKEILLNSNRSNGRESIDQITMETCAKKIIEVYKMAVQ